MWTKKYQPNKSEWFLAKINGEKQVLFWNNSRKFFADFCGKTYNFDDIDSWLDDNLSEKAKEKLQYINGHSIARDFPNIKPSLEWAGAVLDLLDELGLNKIVY